MPILNAGVTLGYGFKSHRARLPFYKKGKSKKWFAIAGAHERIWPFFLISQIFQIAGFLFEEYPECGLRIYLPSPEQFLL